jgi:glycosyltransferase involved in cell wall biosynthesis
MFSIIVPAYNEEGYIARCLQAILALKSRSNVCEVIVVNNASTDWTCEIVAKDFPEVKLIHEPRKGLTIAYNRGAKEARGDILVFVDADMVLQPDHLQKISREFAKDPGLVALSGPYVYRDGGILRQSMVSLVYLFLAMPLELFLNRLLNLGSSIASGNSAIRKEAFEKIGGFDEVLFYGLEADLALRIRRMGKIRFRYSLAAESSVRRLKKEGTVRILFRHIANTIWPYFFGRPFTGDYIDVR